MLGRIGVCMLDFSPAEAPLNKEGRKEEGRCQLVVSRHPGFRCYVNRVGVLYYTSIYLQQAGSGKRDQSEVPESFFWAPTSLESYTTTVKLAWHDCSPPHTINYYFKFLSRKSLPYGWEWPFLE